MNNKNNINNNTELIFDNLEEKILGKIKEFVTKE
jgi:hypothetical protein